MYFFKMCYQSVLFKIHNSSLIFYMNIFYWCIKHIIILTLSTGIKLFFHLIIPNKINYWFTKRMSFYLGWRLLILFWYKWRKRQNKTWKGGNCQFWFLITLHLQIIIWNLYRHQNILIWFNLAPKMFL